MIAQGGNTVVQVISTIALARILLPEDFGLVAMVSAVTGFASALIDLGTRDAIAQHGNVSEGEVSALHWITLAIGVVFTGITALVAPLFARFYHEPRLVYIALVLSSTFVISALYLQQYALMRRALMFRTLALIDVGANVLATLVAIVIAHLGYDYWALVWKQVLLLLFSGFGVWAVCGWWPGRPAFTATVKQLLGFGFNVTGFTLADYVAKSADRVALGYVSGAQQLGYYQNAFLVYDSVIAGSASPLHNVAVATLTKLRDDRAALQRAWSTALASLTYFVAPAFAILAVVGQDFIVLLLGSKWETAGVILGVLALRGPAHVVERTVGWLHVAAGRADRWRHWGVISCVLTVIALFCGLPFGAIGVAAAYAVLTTCLFIPAVVYAGKPLGIRPKDVLRTVGPPVVAALATAAIGFLIRFTLVEDAPRLARFLVLGFVCCAFYLAAMTFIFRVTKPLALLASLVRVRKSSG